MPFDRWGSGTSRWGQRREKTTFEAPIQPQVSTPTVRSEGLTGEGNGDSAPVGLLAQRSETTLDPKGVQKTATPADIDKLSKGVKTAGYLSKIGAVANKSKGLWEAGSTLLTGAGLLGAGSLLAKGKPVEAIAAGVGTFVPAVAMAYGAYSLGKAAYESWNDGGLGDAFDARSYEATRDYAEDRFGWDYDASALYVNLDAGYQTSRDMISAMRESPTSWGQNPTGWDWDRDVAGGGDSFLGDDYGYSSDDGASVQSDLSDYADLSSPTTDPTTRDLSDFYSSGTVGGDGGSSGDSGSNSSGGQGDDSDTSGTGDSSYGGDDGSVGE